MKPLHTVKIAGEVLAVSPWTVRSYIRDGKLIPVRLGRLVRVDEELQRFVAEARTNGAHIQNTQEAK
jgi:excisionase family DNA binding protein